MPKAIDEMKKLPKKMRLRVVNKMDWIVAQEKPLSFGKRLTSERFGTYRFRIGDYRVLCDIQAGTISILLVLSVKDRKEAYERI